MVSEMIGRKAKILERIREGIWFRCSIHSIHTALYACMCMMIIKKHTPKLRVSGWVNTQNIAVVVVNTAFEYVAVSTKQRANEVCRYHVRKKGKICGVQASSSIYRARNRYYGLLWVWIFVSNREWYINTVPYVSL